MKALLKYLKPYWLIALMAPLLMALEVTMDLLQPRLIEKIVDIGVVNQDLNMVIHTGLLMVGLAIIGMLGGVGCTVFSVIASQNTGADLRKELFSHIQDLSFKNIDALNTGNLITTLTNDVTIFQRFILMALRAMVRSPLIVIGSLIMAISTSPQLSWIIISLVPIILIIVLLINKKVYNLYYAVQKKLDKINTVLQENLLGIRVVKSFVRKNFEIDRFEEANEDYTSANIKAARTMVIVMPLIVLAVNLSIIAVLWFGGKAVSYGNLQLGQIIAFINYLLRLLFSVAMLGMILINLSRASVSADRIKNVLDTKPTMIENTTKDDSLQLKGKVEFKNVSFSYCNDYNNLVLSNLNFTIEPGETVAILGETGSGKSTLVSLIPRLYDVTEGQIIVDRKDIRDINTKSLRKQIGFVLQNTVLFSGTIKENIAFGKDDIPQEVIKRAAETAQAKEFITNLPEHYSSTLGQRGVNISGGQKQRLSIARALAVEPSILIFDDCTSAIDLKTEAQILTALKKLMKDTTSIIIAQRISSIMNSDKIIVLENGRISGIGKHEELLKNNDVYRDIYHSQLGEGENQSA